METKLLQLAVNSLSNEVDSLKSQLAELNREFAKFKSIYGGNPNPPPTPEQIEKGKTVLLNAKEVMVILGISFNTLYKLVKQGMIKRIKINQRRVRYPQSSIAEYIENLKYI